MIQFTEHELTAFLGRRVAFDLKATIRFKSANKKEEPQELGSLVTRYLFFLTFIVFLRFQRSSQTPIKGPKIACGKNPASPAIINTTADD
ncbi:hypothetical protein ACFPYJ_32475 [Paenibacillus solisilvae]|uniref:Uncharacterized protein n=1 Tax=Paenibacillus solisilvae TaxID=2486751 RepID=A0ABW0W8H5_9BACL